MRDERFRQLANAYLDREISPVELQHLRNELEANQVRRVDMQSLIRLREAERLLFGDEAAADAGRMAHRWDPQVELATKGRHLAVQLGSVCLLLTVIGSALTGWVWGEEPGLSSVAGLGSGNDALLASGLPTFRISTPEGWNAEASSHDSRQSVGYCLAEAPVRPQRSLTLHVGPLDERARAEWLMAALQESSDFNQWLATHEAQGQEFTVRVFQGDGVLLVTQESW